MPPSLLRFPAEGGPPTTLAYFDNNGIELHYPGSIATAPDGSVYMTEVLYNILVRISPDGEVTLIDDTYGTQRDGGVGVVDDFGRVYLNVSSEGIYRYTPGDPFSRELFLGCDQQNLKICAAGALTLSPDRSEIYSDSYDYSGQHSVVIAIDPNGGTYHDIVIAHLGGMGLAVVPARGDVDCDKDEDLVDLEWLVSCMEGPLTSFIGSCDLADMDADGDVDLLDARFFLWAHSALQD